MNRSYTRLVILLAAVGVMVIPIEARASDMTGAFIYLLGVGLIGCVVLGIVLAVVLKYFFKCGRWVWLLIPGMPIFAVIALVATQFFSGEHERNYHAGPDLEYNGSHSVTVSADFNQKNLELALARINAPSFKQELAHYTTEPLSNYLFSVDLCAPRGRERRHYVTICVQPKVEVNTPTYEGIMFLFTKAVVAADPNPCETFLYTEPPKIR